MGLPTCNPRDPDVVECLAGKACDFSTQTEPHHMEVTDGNRMTMKELEEDGKVQTNLTGVVGGGTVPRGCSQGGPVHQDYIVVTSR